MDKPRVSIDTEAFRRASGAAAGHFPRDAITLRSTMSSKSPCAS
jgi:hypothetical protein